MKPQPRIYLAGPDVFYRGCEQIYQRLQEDCARLGMVGVVPSDGGMAEGFTGSDDALAQRIFEGNIALIKGADGVIANLVNFRGQEPDSGTVFEVGFATGLGKPVVAYNVPDTSYADRVAASMPCQRDAAGVTREVGNGAMVEGLGQRLNLMLTRSTPIAPSAQAALVQIAAMLGASTEAQM